MPLNHIGITTADIQQAEDFYLAALGPLGYRPYITHLDGAVRGYGRRDSGPDFWLTSTDAPSEEGKEGGPKPGATGFLHLAFTARTRNQVRAFYDAAIAAGGKCNGPPGVRPQYFATYYGAFVLDPEGRNIEAVCMKPGFWAEEWSWGVWSALVGSAAIGFGLWWNNWSLRL